MIHRYLRQDTLSLSRRRSRHLPAAVRRKVPRKLHIHYLASHQDERTR